jgi:hypothetical protein
MGPLPEALLGVPPGNDHSVEEIVAPPSAVAVEVKFVVTGKLHAFVTELVKLLVVPGETVTVLELEALGQLSV